MALEDRLQTMLTELRDARAEMRDSKEQPLNSGDGGGTSGGMEARVAKLEADVGHILTAIGELKTSQTAAAKDLTDLKVSSARVETTVSSLPTKDDISKTIRDWILLIGGVLTAINLIALVASRYFPAP